MLKHNFKKNVHKRFYCSYDVVALTQQTLVYIEY